MERVSRINDCKIELGRCSEEELFAMAQEAITRVQVAELEVARINEELRRRRRGAVMGEPECLPE